MEPIFPYLLFILFPGEGEPELTRHPVIYQDEQACQAAASEMMQDYYGVADPPAFRCMAMPGEEEYEALMQRIEAAHVARREAREAEESRQEPRRKP